MSEEAYTELQFEQDTQEHVRKVRENLIKIAFALIERANCHDDSKFSPEERELFIQYTPKLKHCTYGSDEYKQFLKELEPALKHHYGHNAHHPEHWKNGLNDMSLLDIIEMFCDWKASSERHLDGNIHTSIEKNKSRFNMSDQVCSILENTAVWFENKK